MASSAIAIAPRDDGTASPREERRRTTGRLLPHEAVTTSRSSDGSMSPSSRAAGPRRSRDRHRGSPKHLIVRLHPSGGRNRPDARAAGRPAAARRARDRARTRARAEEEERVLRERRRDALASWDDGMGWCHAWRRVGDRTPKKKRGRTCVHVPCFFCVPRRAPARATPLAPWRREARRPGVGGCLSWVISRAASCATERRRRGGKCPRTSDTKQKRVWSASVAMARHGGVVCDGAEARRHEQPPRATRNKSARGPHPFIGTARHRGVIFDGGPTSRRVAASSPASATAAPPWRSGLRQHVPGGAMAWRGVA